MDKFFLSNTLKNRISKANIEKINSETRKEEFNHIKLNNLNNKLIFSQSKDSPIFYAIQKSIPAACLIIVYYEEDGDISHWTGSGFLVSPRLIVTSAHVLPSGKGKTTIQVSFDGIERINATINSINDDLDIGSLLINDVNIKPIPISTEEPMVGEQIAVIGAPEGWENVVTVGYISAKHRTPQKLPGKEWSDMIFIDADIYEGSSGSMVINSNGELIGVVMGIIGKEAKEKSIGQNAVVPIKRVIDALEI